VDVVIRPNLRRLLVPTVAALSVFVFACGGSAENATDGGMSGGHSAAMHDESGLPLVKVHVRWATGNAQSLPALVQSSNVVFAGEVTGLQGQRVREFSASSNSDSSFARDGGAAPEGGLQFPISVFEVRVDQSIVGGLAEGSTVAIQQAGGVTRRSDGSNVKVVLEGDEPLEAGRRYLFFATMGPDGTLSAPPFARLEIGVKGALEPVAGWDQLGALQRLSNVSIHEAEREIDAAAP
jgi:hypothetical protein